MTLLSGTLVRIPGGKYGAAEATPRKGKVSKPSAIVENLSSQTFGWAGISQDSLFAGKAGTFLATCVCAYPTHLVSRYPGVCCKIPRVYARCFKLLGDLRMEKGVRLMDREDVKWPPAEGREAPPGPESGFVRPRTTCGTHDYGTPQDHADRGTTVNCTPALLQQRTWGSSGRSADMSMEAMLDS